MTTKVYNQGLIGRGSDDWGSGAFAASRGGHFHLGRDFIMDVGDEVMSPVDGRVLRIGLPYADEHFRLIEIVDTEVNSLWRLFYVLPVVEVGEIVKKGQLIGRAQGISAKYSEPDRGPMTNHVHIECLVDPALVLNREEI